MSDVKHENRNRALIVEDEFLIALDLEATMTGLGFEICGLAPNAEEARSLAMSTLVFVCPATGHEVSTGVSVDRTTFRKLSRTATQIPCPHCHNNHALSTIAVWLISDEVTDHSPVAKSAA